MKREGELINMTWAWDEKKSESPDRNQTHDLLNTRRVLYPLSYENWWRARSFNWVHMSQASCILHTARISTAEVIIFSDQCTIFIHLSLLVNSVKWCCSPWVIVAQWIEPPPSVCVVMGLILVGSQIFSLSHTRVMLINSPFTFHYWAPNSPSLFTFFIKFVLLTVSISLLESNHCDTFLISWFVLCSIWLRFLYWRNKHVVHPLYSKITVTSN